jgi:hypothetical protein
VRRCPERSVMKRRRKLASDPFLFALRAYPCFISFENHTMEVKLACPDWDVLFSPDLPDADKALECLAALSAGIDCDYEYHQDVRNAYPFSSPSPSACGDSPVGVLPSELEAALTALPARDLMGLMAGTPVGSVVKPKKPVRLATPYARPHDQRGSQRSSASACGFSDASPTPSAAHAARSRPRPASAPSDFAAVVAKSDSLREDVANLEIELNCLRALIGRMSSSGQLCM